MGGGGFSALFLHLLVGGGWGAWGGGGGGAGDDVLCFKIHYDEDLRQEIVY